ncbi:hypothetical protein [Marinomonas posidonica]
MCQMMSLGGFVFSLSEGKLYEGLQRINNADLKCHFNDGIFSVLPT